MFSKAIYRLIKKMNSNGATHLSVASATINFTITNEMRLNILATDRWLLNLQLAPAIDPAIPAASVA